VSAYVVAFSPEALEQLEEIFDYIVRQRVGVFYGGCDYESAA